MQKNSSAAGERKLHMRTAGANEAPTGRPAKNQNGTPDLWQSEEGAGPLGAGTPDEARDRLARTVFRMRALASPDN